MPFKVDYRGLEVFCDTQEEVEALINLVGRRGASAKANASAYRMKRKEALKLCLQKGHVLEPGDDCCQRCKLPVELMAQPRKR